jgi:hypothetical protein
MHQQAWHIEHHASDVLIWMVQHNGASALHPAYIALLPQVVVVKTEIDSDAMRNELQVLEDSNRKEESRLYVPVLLKAQITRGPESNWLVTAPVFGRILRAFGEAMKDSGGVPNWLLAHVFIALMDNVGYMHSAGYSCGTISVENLVLNPYRRVLWHRYRGYPDLVISSISIAQPLSPSGEKQDAAAILAVMEEMITSYSDVAPFLALGADTDANMVTDDPILRVLEGVKALQSQAQVTFQDILARFRDSLVDIRHTGPDTFPRPVARMLHDDIATNEEFGNALREPSVVKFDRRHEEFVRIVADERVEMREGACAGMKTGRILVVRFEERREGWLRIVGLENGDEVGVEEDGAFDWEEDVPEVMDVDGSLFGGD